MRTQLVPPYDVAQFASPLAVATAQHLLAQLICGTTDGRGFRPAFLRFTEIGSLFRQRISGHDLPADVVRLDDLLNQRAIRFTSARLMLASLIGPVAHFAFILRQNRRVDGGLCLGNGDVRWARIGAGASAERPTGHLQRVGQLVGRDRGGDAAAGGTDSTPDAFNIPLMSGLTVNTLQRSETIAIRGINTVAPVSVVDGEYSIGCSGTFTSSPGTISNFDTVCVRRTTAATPRTAVTVRLTIGGVSATWYAITAGGATPPVVIVPSPIAHNAFLGVPFTSPALTTVRSQLELAGERASSHLLALLRGDEASTEEELLPTQLVVRGSTAAIP